MARRDPQTEWLRVKGYRAMTPQRRFEIGQELARQGRWVALNMARRKHKHKSRQMEWDYWNRIYGHEIADTVLNQDNKWNGALELMDDSRIVYTAVEILEGLQIPYALVGGLASIFWGRPRTTQDADILAKIPLQKVEMLVRALGEDFVVSEDAIREAIRRRGEFNAIHQAEVYKVDFWIPASPFDLEVLQRRRRESIAPGIQVYVQSPEDTILSKLRWCKLSNHSERQFQDALGVYEVEYPELDQTYLDHWAGVLDVTDLLAQVRAQAALPPEIE